MFASFADFDILLFLGVRTIKTPSTDVQYANLKVYFKKGKTYSHIMVCPNIVGEKNLKNPLSF